MAVIVNKIGMRSAFRARAVNMPSMPHSALSPRVRITAHSREVVGRVNVAPDFKLTRAGAAAWVENGYRKPRRALAAMSSGG